ncbi:hypothetical protein ABTX99_34540 [Streptomyces flaveolus]|uniref:hypothetical protein n=1 Tax=Streptomyces flaveolus TaxID=67297 RepID=UPI00331F5A6B
MDLLRQDLTTLAALIDTRRRTCTELRTRLNTGPRYGQNPATTHDLAATENNLEGLERRYADTQTEFALSVTLGRTFDQVRNPPPPHATAALQHSAGAAPRPARRTTPSTPTGHDQATAAALRPGPAAHGRTAGA